MIAVSVSLSCWDSPAPLGLRPNPVCRQGGSHCRVQPAGPDTASTRGRYVLAPRRRLAGRVRACPAGPAAECRAIDRVLDLGGQEGNRKGPRPGHVLRGRLRPQPLRDLPRGPHARGRPGRPRRAPSAAALADAKEQSNRWQVHWIKRWDLKRPLDDAQIHAIKEALAHGHPVACGLRGPRSSKATNCSRCRRPMPWKTVIALRWSVTWTTPEQRRGIPVPQQLGTEVG